MKRYIILGIVCLFMSCETKSKIDWNYLFQKYSHDSLKCVALTFLRNNMDDLTSEELEYYKKERKISRLNLSQFKNYDSFNHYMESNGLSIKYKYTNDKQIVTTRLIESTIDKAFSDWKKYPWNKNVSFENFLEFLLPYKIANEYPEDWRSLFSKKYEKSINDLVYKFDTGIVYKDYYKDPNDIYYNGYLDNCDWFKYSNTTKIGNVASLTEILSFKEGDCYVGSFLGVYMLRAFGVPSTIDYVPYWGSKNSGHATEVFLDTTGKMTTASGRNIQRPAKVFRITFKKNNIWKDSIEPFVDKQFILTNLKNNHWKDVTNEHAETVDIKIKIKQSNYKYAYICVNNYGNWLPIYWSSIDKKDNTVIFKNMGVSMLYKVAIPYKNKFKILSDIIMVDSIGNVINYDLDKSQMIDINLRKINSGSESWLKKDTTYDLYVRDNNSWQFITSKKCLKDSLIRVSALPKNGLYLLKEKNNSNNLERPFTFTYDSQFWW